MTLYTVSRWDPHCKDRGYRRPEVHVAAPDALAALAAARGHEWPEDCTDEWEIRAHVTPLIVVLPDEDGDDPRAGSR